MSDFLKNLGFKAASKMYGAGIAATVGQAISGTVVSVIEKVFNTDLSPEVETAYQVVFVSAATMVVTWFFPANAKPKG